MPTLNWLGKDKIEAHHRDVPFHVLRRRYSYPAEPDASAADNANAAADTATTGATATCASTVTPENMIVHGDNLVALKALLPQFEGMVGCIYIDPPYNTGNEDWVYNDNVADPQMMRWLGEAVGREGEDLSRHDKWLCMMMPRLQLLNRLMSPDGAIFISIDRNEFAALKCLCDGIFGHFAGCISWQRTYSPRNDSKGIVSETEYILVYSKSADWQPNRLERTDEMDAKYKNPDNDWCAWCSSDAFAPGALTHQGMVYAVQHPITGELIYPTKNRCWALEQQEVLRIMNEWCPYELRVLNDSRERAKVCGLAEEDVRRNVPAIVLKEPLRTSRRMAKAVMKRGQWPRLYFTRNGEGGIRRKSYLAQMEGRAVTNLWTYNEVGHTDEAKKELKDIFGGEMPFDTPKPTRLIERILRIATKPDSLVLDSFAGSGTTAHAVMRMNAADGGHRRFILIEMMDYAESTTAERVKRIIGGYATRQKHEVELYSKKLTPKSLIDGAEMVAEAEEVARKARERYADVSRPKVEDGSLKVTASAVTDGVVEGLGGRFSYYEVGPRLFTDDGYLNPDISTEELRRYVYYSETGQMPVPADEDSYLLGRKDGCACYLCHKPGAGMQLSYDTLQIVKERAEQYVIYADSCTLSEEFMTAHNIVYKKIPRDIKRF